MTRKVLFHRDFRVLTGGHLKVWDYYGHVNNMPGYQTSILFTRESTWDASNPWLSAKENIEAWKPEEADIWFLAGLDWNALDEKERVSPSVPVINLIQGLGHADPDNRLYEFLRYPAVRICVSHPVAEAIKATGQVNGPVFVIENGINPDDWPQPRPWDKRTYDLLICGNKRQAMAKNLAENLSSDYEVCLLTTLLPRMEFLAKLADTRAAICLPLDAEGFYLPALEAMAQGSLVVCPDCVGNRDFCQHGETCWMPGYNVNELAQAARNALAAPEIVRVKTQKAAMRKVERHTLERESRAFQTILRQLDKLWRHTERG